MLYLSETEVQDFTPPMLHNAILVTPERVRSEPNIVDDITYLIRTYGGHIADYPRIRYTERCYMVGLSPHLHPHEIVCESILWAMMHHFIINPWDGREILRPRSFPSRLGSVCLICHLSYGLGQWWRGLFLSLCAIILFCLVNMFLRKSLECILSLVSYSLSGFGFDGRHAKISGPIWQLWYPR